jgi:hypothetical protein
MFTLVTKDYATVAILLCILLLYLVFFRAIGSYDVMQIIAALRRNKSIKQSTKSFRIHFEDMQLEFRQATTFDHWWKLVCTAAVRLGFHSLKLEITNRDGSRQILEWQRKADLTLSKAEDASGAKSGFGRTEGLIAIDLPLNDRRSDQILQMHTELCIDKSLESTGTRLTLFMRLLDEHGIHTLPPEDADS